MLRTNWPGCGRTGCACCSPSLAIALGVGFIAGTFVLTDTIEVGFTQKFSGGGRPDRRRRVPVPETARRDAAPCRRRDLEKIRAVDGVADAQGLVRGTSALIGRDGKAAGGLPTAGISLPEGD